MNKILYVINSKEKAIGYDKDYITSEILNIEASIDPESNNIKINNIDFDEFYESIEGTNKIVFTSNFVCVGLNETQFLYNNTTHLGCDVFYKNNSFLFEFDSINKFISYCNSILCTSFARISRNRDGFINLASQQEGKTLYVYDNGKFSFNISGVNAFTDLVILHNYDKETIVPLNILKKYHWDIELIDGKRIIDALESVVYSFDIDETEITSHPKEHFLVIENSFKLENELSGFIIKRDIIRIVY